MLRVLQLPFELTEHLVGLLRSVGDTLILWQGRARSRYHLERLNDHQLRDVGLHPDDVRREAEKPFWKV